MAVAKGMVVAVHLRAFWHRRSPAIVRRGPFANEDWFVRIGAVECGSFYSAHPFSIPLNRSSSLATGSIIRLQESVVPLRTNANLKLAGKSLSSAVNTRSAVPFGGRSPLILSTASSRFTGGATEIGGPPGRIYTVRHQHTDEWLVQRAVADRKRRLERLRGLPRPVSSEEKVVETRREFQGEGGDYILPAEGSVEEKLGSVLGRPDLIVTRNVEWANLAFGFEQQNKYVIMDPREPQAPVGYILENSSVLLRQFLRRRRPFTAQVLNAAGEEICLVRRPVWFINSTIFVEVDGKVIGEAHRRWHLWRRVYDCYLGEKQFAAVDNAGFWYWTFILNDIQQGILAVIDRNWRGFGFEFLTDAGQYVVRFGDAIPDYLPSPPRRDAVRVGNRPFLSSSGTASNEIQSLQTAAQEAEDLVVSRPLSLTERAVVLALAVSLDNDYFSQHSSGFGFLPIPFFGGSEVADS